MSKEQKLWKFDRYVNGQLMAEGAIVHNATTDEEALERAKALFRYPDNTEFKLRPD